MVCPRLLVVYTDITCNGQALHTKQLDGKRMNKSTMSQLMSAYDQQTYRQLLKLFAQSDLMSWSHVTSPTWSVLRAVLQVQTRQKKVIPLFMLHLIVYFIIICICIYMCICIYIYVHMYIHIHTYIYNIISM